MTEFTDPSELGGIVFENKRPCCRMMKALAQRADSLKDPEEVSQALNVISEHCELMKLMGQSAVKWDLSKSHCYLAVFPEDAQAIIDEIAITFAAFDYLHYFDALLFHLAGVLAHNAKLKQLSDKLPFALAEIREGEKKFGAVPETNLLKDNKVQNTLQAGDLLKAHPFLDKPQMDGAPPKDTPSPVQNSEAAENAEKLQYQLQLQPGQKYTHGMSAAPKFKPGGMGG